MRHDESYVIGSKIVVGKDFLYILCYGVYCVTFIGEDSLSLAVAAPEGGLTQTDTARIVDVVQQTADFTAEQIKIIEVA